MQILIRSGRDLSPDVALALAQYRYRIFVSSLGWNLPTHHPACEHDQFDRHDTLYVIATNAANTICGCARLLPTTQPYLLQHIFPPLHPSDSLPPESPHVWEMSRFAMCAQPAPHANSHGNHARLQALLTAVIQCALHHNAHQIIGVTFPAIERLFRRIGIHTHRISPPRHIDGKSVVTCAINLDHHTLAVLGIDRQSPGPN